MEPPSPVPGSAVARSPDPATPPPRRDWELWSIALILLTVVAGAGITFAYLSTREPAPVSPWVTRFLWLLLFGLIALVLLLNVYLIDKKRVIAQLQQRTAEQEVELKQQHGHAVTDPLTQVYNRRFFDEVVPKEARRAVRANRPLSVLLVDVDNFRRINADLGHFVGDEVLRQVAELLRSALRSSDYVFRFGGDEFLLVLPETDDAGAAVVLQRLQQALAARQDLHQRVGRRVTLTVGPATFLAGRTLESVIEEAEARVQSLRADVTQAELKTTGRT